MNFALKVSHIANMESFACVADKMIDAMLNDSSDEDEEDQELRETLKIIKGDVEKIKKQANKQKGLLADEIEKQLFNGTAAEHVANETQESKNQESKKKRKLY